MGCLRNGAIVALATFIGVLLGFRLGDSLIPVPGWLVRLFVRDDRVDLALDAAHTAGRIWGGMQGGFYGLLLGIALAVFLTYRTKRR